MVESDLPEAGLYRTLYPHPQQGDAIGAHQLVFFAPVSDQGPPIVLRPDGRNGRVWTFGNQGVLADDMDWLHTLVPLPNQGYYELQRPLIFAVGQELPQRLLVFLSYDQAANAVVFPGVSLPDQTIAFGSDAIALSDLQIDALGPVTFGLAKPAEEPSTVH